MRHCKLNDSSDDDDDDDDDNDDTAMSRERPVLEGRTHGCFWKVFFCFSHLHPAINCYALRRNYRKRITTSQTHQIQNLIPGLYGELVPV